MKTNDLSTIKCSLELISSMITYGMMQDNVDSISGEEDDIKSNKNFSLNKKDFTTFKSVLKKSKNWIQPINYTDILNMVEPKLEN